ncbi:hypothetical protein PSACC_03725 [Paramicrosporidium saccamoebae]|uniref:Uncharacterized protein n=1 Tax=Paramicrosporidium saccamoebae TaxID=1246581 RepID=A0A2H9TFG4_9FUNG|nr:hypothetical protein PSACC_03725 [Paramicrosporidium saccamoebae]
MLQLVVLLWVFGLTSSIRIISSPAQICTMLSMEGLEALIHSHSLAKPHAVNLARLLASDYYPFHRIYISDQMDDQRAMLLVSLVSVLELHDTLLPLEMLTRNNWLVLYFLNTNSGGYFGKIATESFRPFLFNDFIRPILLQWVVENLPGSVHSFAWQRYLNDQQTTSRVICVALQSWDALDFTSLPGSLLVLLNRQENFGNVNQLISRQNDPNASLLRAIKCAMAAAMMNRRGILLRKLFLTTLTTVKADLKVSSWCWCLSTGGNCKREFSDFWGHLCRLGEGEMSDRATILLHDLMANSIIVADISASSSTPMTKVMNTLGRHQLYPARWNQFCAKYHRVCRTLCADYRLPDRAERFRQEARCVLDEEDRWLDVETDRQGVVEITSLSSLLRLYASDRVAVNTRFVTSVRFGISNPPIWSLMDLLLQVKELITKTDLLFGHYRTERCWSYPIDRNLFEVYLRMIIYFLVYGKKLIVAPLLPAVDSTHNLEKVLVEQIQFHQCPSTVPVGNSAQLMAREATAGLDALVKEVGLATLHKALTE